MTNMTTQRLRDIQKQGEQFEGYGLIKSVQAGKTNGGSGAPFFSIVLSEQEKSFNCKLWENSFGQYSVEELKNDILKTGNLLHVKASSSEYKGDIQLTISKLQPVNEGEADIADFIQSAPEPLEAMQTEFEGYLNDIQNPFIKEVCTDVYEEFKDAFLVHPAAKSLHQAYRSGLLYHSLSMLRIAKTICALHPEANRDIVYGAIAVHDIGKVVELTGFLAPEYTKVGNYLGHITIGTMFLDRKIQKMKEEKNKWSREDYQLGYELMHAVVAHHGELAYGSPSEPKTLEALIVSQVDLMDSRINMVIEGLNDDTISPNEPKKIFPVGTFYKTNFSQ